MAEVVWPAELLVGKINWTSPSALLRQVSAWTGATREVELGPAGHWLASVPVHVKDRHMGARAFRRFDALMRQAGAWTKLPAKGFPQAADDPALTLAADIPAGARSATLTSAMASVALARAGDLITIRLGSGGWQMVTLLTDIDADANGKASISWAEPLRAPAALGGVAEACNPFVAMRYAQRPGFAQLPGEYFEISAIEFEEAF